MNPNHSLPHRKKLRIPDFDYSQPGAYYVTIVTQDRKTLFGQVVDGEMVLNEVGKMVKEVIDQIPDHYPGIDVELFVVMPNHIHILFHLSDVLADPRVCQTGQTKIGQPRGVDPTKENLFLQERDPCAGVVAGPRACQTDQTKSGQPQGVYSLRTISKIYVSGDHSAPKKLTKRRGSLKLSG